MSLKDGKQQKISTTCRRVFDGGKSVLRGQIGNRRMRFNDGQRRRLVSKAKKCPGGYVVNVYASDSD